MARHLNATKRVHTRWTPEMVAELRAHVSRNELFMTEIAEKMGLSRVAVLNKCRALGIRTNPEGRKAEWNRKHVHLREPAMRFFMTHSMEETRKHFGLTKSEIKSVFTVGYQDPKLKHLRKEWRPHTAWTTEDWVFMAQNVGIQPREWIGRKLKRGTTYNSVKDALAKFRGHGKYMNGMPLQWWSQVFGEEAMPYSILTKAGPTGAAGYFHYRIIPWVTCERLIDQGKVRRVYGKGQCTPERKASAPPIVIDPAVISGIRSMAQFQRWIYGCESERVIISRIKSTLRRR